MLEYCHSSKAGNHGDVLKHILWKLLLTEKQNETNGLLIVDTHAGNGRYVISSSSAQKGDQEEVFYYCKGARSGIAKVFEQQQKDQKDNANETHSVVRDYLRVVLQVHAKYCCTDNDQEKIILSKTKISLLSLYPGSPLLTQIAGRPCEEHVFFEMNESHYQDLKEVLKDFNHSSTKIHNQNGLEMGPAAIQQNTSAGKECLCLIDPPYETDDECQEVLTAVGQILRTNSCVSLMIWIPSFVNNHPRNELFLDLLSSLKSLTASMMSICSTLLISLQISNKGMNGSHVFIINPPSKFHSILESSQTLPWLAQTLEQDAGCSSYNIDYQ
eukprot:CAMPEP_0194264466 /NCGR_PEP_ID=MMETSP0158-20130606/47600_1 /TAXON_ID=33649 /ORGANISM="Thalassionema nitzschioides, Strain L26-B" /LENGTH=327 /DNA_ID=CAMNT_0039004705 /DNA_START=10 /DNA_END=990 /DNA_ORIENTATION=+